MIKARLNLRNMVKTVAYLVVCMLFVACDKDKDNGINEDTYALDEPMSEEFLAFLESLETVSISDFDFDKQKIQKSGDNGCQSIQSLFSALIEKATYLTDKVNFPYITIKGENDNQPAQNDGLAYVWGNLKGKNINIRRPASRYSTNCKCKEELYGLDCSGLIEYIFNKINCTKLNNKTAHDQFNIIMSWTEINTSVYKGNIIVEELEEKDIDEYGLKSGDIIVHWESNDTVSHIGLILNDGKKSGIVHSLGTWRNKCNINRDANHGPIISSLTPENIKEYFAKRGKAKVLRIKPRVFEVVPNELRFDNTGGNKTFEIKTSFPIEDVKALDNSICSTVRPFGVPQTCGDTTIYTYNVIVDENLSYKERNTQIVVSARINNRDSIDIIQEANKPIKFHMEADLIIKGATTHYSSDVFMYADASYNPNAYMPGFKWTEMVWGTSNFNLAFRYDTTFSYFGEEPDGTWHGNFLQVLLESKFQIGGWGGHFPKIGESTNGTIAFLGDYGWWGLTPYDPERFGGTFTLKRIE